MYSYSVCSASLVEVLSDKDREGNGNSERQRSAMRSLHFGLILLRRAADQEHVRLMSLERRTPFVNHKREPWPAVRFAEFVPDDNAVESALILNIGPAKKQHSTHHHDIWRVFGRWRSFLFSKA